MKKSYIIQERYSIINAYWFDLYISDNKEMVLNMLEILKKKNNSSIYRLVVLYYE